MIFSKDLEQMLTLRDVELISRIATSPREMYDEIERCREEPQRSCLVTGVTSRIAFESRRELGSGGA